MHKGPFAGHALKIVVLLLMLEFLSSCYPEYRLARTYINNDHRVSLLILPANYIFKKNLKVDEFENKDSIAGYQLDSALMANSMFLSKVSDSIFLERFVNSMIDEFIRLGYDVYTEGMLDSFLYVKGPAYILNIAQIELEEHYDVHEARQQVGDYTYFKNIDLNAISYNFWFELNELNAETKDPKILFAGETINDVVHGYFTESLFTGEVAYKYDIDEIDMDIIYQYSQYFGRRCAGYTFDYLMNKYIEMNWPPGQNLRYYMQYKRENNSLDPTIQDRFIELKD